MSRILCVIDGMTDPDFSVSDYPNLSTMRILEYRDNCGGSEPETLNCVLSLLGVKEIPHFLRGYIEALGAGVAVLEDDLILRGSYYSLDENGCCDSPEKAPESFFDSGFDYHFLGGNQCLLVFHGLSKEVEQLKTFSPIESAGREAKSLCPIGCEEVKCCFEHFLTSNSCMLLWGQSVMAKIELFAVSAAAVCKKNIVKGIAKALKMQLIEPQNATADTDTDLMEKAKSALTAAEQYPFVLLHINGADEAAHRKNGLEKRKFLSLVDEKVLSRLLASQHKIIVAADHGCDFYTGAHTNALQPVFIRE